MLETALGLAAEGFAVFPCVPGGKQPLHQGGFKNATRDPETIRRWWTDEPHANPAIWPEACEPRLVVVDVDVKGGRPGADSLLDLQLEGVLPDTLTVTTPSGGLHLYYSLTAEAPLVPNSVDRLAPGVDVRAANGYVLAPGAVVGGSLYRRDRTCRPVPASADLVGRTGRAMDRQDRNDAAVDLDLEANVARARDYLEREAAAGRVAIEGHGGNDFTYRTAALVRDFGISEDTCLDLLLETWNPSCQPPWSREELETIVHNAFEYAQRTDSAARAVSAHSLDQMAASAATRLSSAPTATSDNPYRPKGWDAVEAMPDPVWLIADTIPERSVSLVYGPVGAYKSFLVTDMLVRLSLGLPWAGHETKGPCNVTYVAGEGAAGFRKRRAGMAITLGVERIPGLFLVDRMPPFSDVEQLRLFAEARDERPKVIVFDTVQWATVGMDENSAGDMGLFLARCQELARAFDCAVILIHHSGKDEDRGARGSSVFRAAADVVLRVSSPAPQKAVVHMEKQKDAEPWAKSQGFDLVASGASLAPQPIAASALVPDQTRVQDDRRWYALRHVLGKYDQALATNELAAEISIELAPELSAADRDRHVAALRKWLQRAANDIAAAPYLLHKGGSRHDPSLWKPKEA